MVWEQERVFLAGEHLRKHSQNIEHKDSLSTAEHPKRKKQWFPLKFAHRNKLPKIHFWRDAVSRAATKLNNQVKSTICRSNPSTVNTQD